MFFILILYLCRGIWRSVSYTLFKQVLTQVLVSLLLLVSTVSEAKINERELSSSKSLVFKVHKQNRIIGTIFIDRYVQGNKVSYQVKSEITAQLIFKVRVLCEEKAVFENGVLIYSQILRECNNKVREDKMLTYQGDNRYQLKAHDGDEYLEIREIKQNLVTLYFKEPQNAKYVFCDNKIEMVPVKQLDKGIYRVQITGNKYLNFYYTLGKCVKVEVVNPLFKVTLIPE